MEINGKKLTPEELLEWIMSPDPENKSEISQAVIEKANSYIGKKVKVTHDYFEPTEHLIITINRVDFSLEESDEPVLWDDTLSQWVTQEYADKNMIN